MKAVDFYVCKKPPKLIGYHSVVPWTTAQLVSFIIHIYTSSNAKNAVKIDQVVAEIFSRICQFFAISSKRCISYPCNLWSYWTDLIQNYMMKLVYCHGIFFELELWYCNFLECRCIYPNFAVKLVAMATSLEESDKKVRIIHIYANTYCLVKKMVKICSVDPDIIGHKLK